VVACRATAEALAKLFAGKAAQDGSPTVFVCENLTCQAPVVGKQSAMEIWKKLEIGAPTMSETDISITGEPITDAMCRFTVDQPVYPDKSFAFLSKEAADDSPLAKRLFEIDGVTRVLISHNQVTLNKSAEADWPVIGKSIGAAIRAHLASGDPAVSDAVWENVPSSEEIRERVQHVLDSEINPSVAEHGGVVSLIDVQDNQVFIQMGGGCQGCGQADVTLKFGIENSIRATIPGVGDILDVTDHAAGRNPFYTPSTK
jgi:Fe-S cluster biogenesis protein NfuA